MAAAVTNANPAGAGLNTSGDLTMNQSMTNQNQGADNSQENFDDQNIFLVDEVFDEEKIMGSQIFQQQAKLLDDPKLENNEMHKKLVNRLTGFYLN